MPDRAEGDRPNVPRDDELDALTVTELKDIRDTLDALMTRLDPGDTVREFAGRVNARLLALTEYDEPDEPVGGDGVFTLTTTTRGRRTKVYLGVRISRRTTLRFRIF